MYSLPPLSSGNASTIYLIRFAHVFKSHFLVMSVRYRILPRRISLPEALAFSTSLTDSGTFLPTALEYESTLCHRFRPSVMRCCWLDGFYTVRSFPADIPITYPKMLIDCYRRQSHCRFVAMLVSLTSCCLISRLFCDYLCRGICLKPPLPACAMQRTDGQLTYRPVCRVFTIFV